MDDVLWIGPAIVLLAGYLLGSIPFGLLLTRAAGTTDLRELGSGNIGATNVLRTGRKDLAAATLVLDAAKGALAVVIGGSALASGAMSGDTVGGATLAGVGAFLGHLYPIWLRGRGGKGVATLLGIALGLSWPAGLVFAGVWLTGLLVTRYSSIGGMGAAMSLPVAAALLDRFDLVLVFLAMLLLVLWKHRANIARLLAGAEPRVGTRRAAEIEP